jgi:hypothetical protein
MEPRQSAYNQLAQPDLAGPVWEWDGMSPAGIVCGRIIRLPQSTIIKHVRETGNHAAFDEALWIPDVTRSAAAIFRGLGRDGQDEAFCYVGIPSGEFASNCRREDLALPDGQTFLVFLRGDLEVSKWRTCKSDPRRPGFPIDHETRFGARLWPTD